MFGFLSQGKTMVIRSDDPAFMAERDGWPVSEVAELNPVEIGIMGADGRTTCWGSRDTSQGKSYVQCETAHERRQKGLEPCPEVESYESVAEFRERWRE